MSLIHGPPWSNTCTQWAHGWDIYGPIMGPFGSIMGPDWAQTGSNIWAHRRFNQGPLTHFFFYKKRNKRETAINIYIYIHDVLQICYHKWESKHHGPTMGRNRMIWAHHGPKHWPTICHAWAQLDLFGPEIAPNGLNNISIWPRLHPTTIDLCFNLDPCGPNLGQLMHIWVNLGSMFDPIWAHGWAHGGPKAYKRVADSVHVGHLLVASVGCVE
jgi:hypothetical protein